MNDSTTKSTLLLLARIIGGLSLLVAAWFKLKADPLVFKLSVEGFKMLPADLVPVVSRYMPWAEAIIGGALLLGIWSRQSGLLTALLYGVFTIAIINALARGLSINCGCFGDLFGPTKISWWLVLRNVALVTPVVFVVVHGGGRFALTHDRISSRRVADAEVPAAVPESGTPAG